MTDAFAHLNALRAGLSHERARLTNAKKAGEIAARTVWVAQYEKQIADEIAFLAKRGVIEPTLDDIDDDELLAALLD
jgi:hypothetical protein